MTRSRGLLNTWEGGHDAKEPCAVPTGVPAADADLNPVASLNTATDFHVGFQALFATARVGANVLEIFDCLLGFVGVDIVGDDKEGFAAETKK